MLRTSAPLIGALGVNQAMIWLSAIVVLFFLVLFPGFRKFVLGLVVAIALIAYLYTENEKAEREKSRTRIARSEIDLTDVTLKPEYSTYKLAGRVKNNSRIYTLSSITLKVTMQDCPKQESPDGCVRIGEESESIYVNVPPAQARDFDRSVYFLSGTIRPKGVLRWHYSIEELEGKH